jgi:phage-related protein
MTFVTFRRQRDKQQDIRFTEFKWDWSLTIGSQCRVLDQESERYGFTMEGEFRVMYVAKFGDKIYVLHCFHKKTKKTSEVDIRLAKKRYADLLTHLRETKK